MAGERPMIAHSKWMPGAALLLALSAAGCDRNPMDANRATMGRWAEELDRDGSRLREQIEAMRQLPPDQWHLRMDEHAGLVLEVLDRIEDRMDEMAQMGGMTADMGGTAMAMGSLGSMMGMSAQRSQELTGRMEELRNDIQQLRGVAPGEVVERMPGHLERLEEMVRIIEDAAAHMRTMAGLGDTR